MNFKFTKVKVIVSSLLGLIVAFVYFLSIPICTVCYENVCSDICAIF